MGLSAAERVLQICEKCWKRCQCCPFQKAWISLLVVPGINANLRYLFGSDYKKLPYCIRLGLIVRNVSAVGTLFYSLVCLVAIAISPFYDCGVRQRHGAGGNLLHVMLTPSTHREASVIQRSWALKWFLKQVKNVGYDYTRSWSYRACIYKPRKTALLASFPGRWGLFPLIINLAR